MKRYGAWNKTLFGLSILLSILGLIFIAEASSPQALQTFGDRLYFFKQQLVWIGVGVFLMIVFSFLDYKVWFKLHYPIYLLSLLSLIIVFIPGVGISAYGATRWIDLGFLSFQPSEIAKMSIIIFLASLCQKKRKLIHLLIFLGLYSILILLEPDLGTAFILTAIGISQIFTYGVPLFKFFSLGLVLAATFFLSIIFSSYRKLRLMTFIKGNFDPRGSSYHIQQILYSLGLGGIWGVGIGASRQKYLYLPEAATDSIFAVIAEEIGFVGSLVIIALFVLFILQCFKIAKKAPDEFSKQFAVGVGSWVSLQTIANLGSMTALLPLTGVPLPFISYGGTSICMLLASIGILLSISRTINSNEKRKK